MIKKLIMMAVVLFIAIQANAAPKTVSGVVNINTATAEELMTLPGIGKAKAEAIISFRQTQPFKSIDQIKDVKGIGDKMFEKIAPYLTIDASSSAKAPTGSAPAAQVTSLASAHTGSTGK